MSDDNNDTYGVGQSNGLLDSDANVQASTLNQLGIANIAGVGQSATSGNNTQSNGSLIFDTGTAFSVIGGDNNDTYTVNQLNNMFDSDQNLNVSTVGQNGLLNIAGVDQTTTSGDNDQSNSSTIFDTGLSIDFIGASNNDTYNVGQGNGLADNDFNVGVSQVAQTGFLNIAGVDQDITSGGNSQDNTSAIFDSGTAVSFASLGSNNDTYNVTQLNNMFDNDQNANASTVAQNGLVNVAGVGQAITSGGNTQDNTSFIADSGDSFVGLGLGDNNDTYNIGQANNLIDNDQNINLSQVGQLGVLNIATVDQDITSGGNDQSNTSTVFDSGSSVALLAAGQNNDTYAVGQFNGLNDSDLNLNGSGVLQVGGLNIAGVDQDITSGGNTQSNDSSIADFGSTFAVVAGGNNNDDYAVSQQNLLGDQDFNTNASTVVQGGLLNIAGVDQDITSGGNSQSNSSTISDFGASAGLLVGSSNNDEYDVSQSNLMFDNDINTNVSIVTQIGAGNFADVDQSIDSGGNTQNNTSGIFDFGVGGLSDNNNDSYDVEQVNLLVDNDANANASSVSQATLFNFADVDQTVDSGGNSQGNSSSIVDLGL